jgi:ATP-binding cassette subfamily B protein
MFPGFLAVLAFAWRHWRRHPRRLLLLTLALAGATLAEINIPVWIGQLIDALGARDPSAAVDALVLILALSLTFQVFHKGGDYIWCRLALDVMRQIGADAFARVQRYSTEWHANTFAGATVRKITRGIWAFDDFGDALYISLVPAASVVLGVAVLTAVQWPLMGGLVIAGAALYTTVSAYMASAYVSPRWRHAVEVDSRLGGSLADAITCIGVVKTAGAERREDERLARLLESWRQRMLRAWSAAIDTAVVQSATMLSLYLVLIGGALWLWRQGRATPGDVAFVITSFFMIDRYLRDVGTQIQTLQRATNDLEDVVAYARTPPDVIDRLGAGTLRVPRGAIRFERVRFVYPGQDQAVFEDFSIAIRPGEKVALVGRSGSGKTTFVKLLLRLYDLDGGRITIDGADIALVTQASLRRATALVPQDPALFHRSLAENIAYARPEATDAEIVRAARLAHAHDFITSLPQGYDTLVGERGVKLSGGERQRVAIARAILADRPVLILDEATSSLDSVSEQAIQAGLVELMAGRTTIVIAHRLSTIRRVDRILVFEEGRIVEEGTHDALLARPDGHYRSLYATQARAFDAEPML